MINVHLDRGYARTDWMLKHIQKYANILAIFNAYQFIRLTIICLNTLTAFFLLTKHTKTPALCVWLPHDSQSNPWLFPSVGIPTS